MVSWRKNLGQTIALKFPTSCRAASARCLPRIQRQNANALAITRFLQSHPAVHHVAYPGLPESPWHALAKAQMSGFGGMVTFEVAGNLQVATAVIDRLRLIALASIPRGEKSLAT